MKRKITNYHCTELLAILAQIDPMDLENKTWTVEAGKTTYSPDDFVARKPVYINGQEVGWVALDQMQDLDALDRK